MRTGTTGFGITMTVWTVMQSTTTEMTWLSNKIHQDYKVTAASMSFLYGTAWSEALGTMPDEMDTAHIRRLCDFLT